MDFLKKDCNGGDEDDEPEYATISRRKDTRDKCIQVEVHRGEGTGDGMPGHETELSVSSDGFGDGGGRNAGGGVEEREGVDFERSILQLSYRLSDEEELLHRIIELCDSKEVR